MKKALSQLMLLFSLSFGQNEQWQYYFEKEILKSKVKF
jgi:hypothetical protein